MPRFHIAVVATLVSLTAAYTTARRVFSEGDGGISCYRIPAIVRTTKGTLLAFAEARHGGCGDGQVHQIAMKRSTDNGVTWSNVSFAAGNDAHLVGNPYPIALNSGKVALVYVKHGPGCIGDCGTGNGVTFSVDDGLSWSKELDVSEGFGAAKGSLPGPGAGVQLQGSGRLLAASHHSAYQNVYITYSDNDGATWKTAPQHFPQMDESTLADLGGDEVLLNMRHQHEKTLGRAVARSHDGGLTWSNITYDKTLIGPTCEASLASIGKSVFFSNPADPSARDKITVRRSDDGGKTWPASLLIQSGKSAGYSSIVQGTVGDEKHSAVLYESIDAGCIDLAVFALDLQERPNVDAFIV